MKKRLTKTTFLIMTLFIIISGKQTFERYFMSSGDKKISYTEMDNFLLKMMDSLRIPGLDIAIIENGKVTYHQTFGVTNTNTKDKINNKTLFEAASFSKPLFAYFVMKQVDKGLLELDTPLYKYLPYPDIAYDDRYKLITARYALSHQTGFPNWRYDEPDKKLDILFKPGTAFKYSGEGYQYLAKVIAHLNNIEEEKLDSIFRKEITEPLGADYLYYNWDDSVAKYMAYGHKNGKPTDNIQRPNNPEETRLNYEFGAGYSLNSNAVNYSKFLIALLKREGLEEESFNELLKKQVKLPVDNIILRCTGTPYWTLGFAMDSTKNGLVYSHFGDNEDYTSYFNFYPDKKTGFVIFSNSEKIMYTDFITQLGVFLGEDIKCDPTQFD
jgi:CubicO group peptidase (beta-lactamase class C family)